MRKIHSVVLLTLLLMITTACNHKPRNLIKEPQMVALLTDAYQLEGFYAVERGMDSLITDPVILATYDSIFNKHGVTRQQFDESMYYYMCHADKYEKIHKAVVENLDAKIKELR